MLLPRWFGHERKSVSLLLEPILRWLTSQWGHNLQWDAPKVLTCLILQLWDKIKKSGSASCGPDAGLGVGWVLFLVYLLFSATNRPPSDIWQTHLCTVCIQQMQLGSLVVLNVCLLISSIDSSSNCFAKIWEEKNTVCKFATDSVSINGCNVCWIGYLFQWMPGVLVALKIMHGTWVLGLWWRTMGSKHAAEWLQCSLMCPQGGNLSPPVWQACTDNPSTPSPVCHCVGLCGRVETSFSSPPGLCPHSLTLHLRDAC